jgi:hypothetical protein
VSARLLALGALYLVLSASAAPATGQELEVTYLANEGVVAFHVAVPEAPAAYHGPASSHEGLLRRVAELAPGVTVLTRPGQRVVLPAGAR